MRHAHTPIAVLCSLVLLDPGGLMADSPGTTAPAAARSQGFLSSVTAPYQTRTFAPVNVHDSPRLETMSSILRS